MNILSIDFLPFHVEETGSLFYDPELRTMLEIHQCLGQ